MCSSGAKFPLCCPTWVLALAVSVYSVLLRGAWAQASTAACRENQTVPGLPELGLVPVLGQFQLSLPTDGVAGLQMGFVLQVQAASMLPVSSPCRARWEQAWNAVQGLQMELPYGAWPGSALQPPLVYVVDAKAATKQGPLALDSGAIPRGPILVIAPSPKFRSDVLLSLPVNRTFSRNPAKLGELSPTSINTLKAQMFNDGKWKTLASVLRKGLDSGASSTYTNATHTLDPPDMLAVRCASLAGAIAIVQSRVTPAEVPGSAGQRSQGMGVLSLWIVLVVLAGTALLGFVIWRLYTWIEEHGGLDEFIEKRRCLHCVSCCAFVCVCIQVCRIQVCMCVL